MSSATGRSRTLWLGCAGALLLLALAAYAARHAHRLDSDLMGRVIVADESRKEAVAHAIAWLGDPLALILMLAVAGAIAIARGRPQDAAAALLIVVGASVTTQLLKVLVAEPHPAAILSGHELNQGSFPSGHVTAVTAMAFAFALVVGPRWRGVVGAIGAAAALAVGASVVALTWHYPSDVAGGILVASAWGRGGVARMEMLPRRGGGRRRLPPGPADFP